MLTQIAKPLTGTVQLGNHPFRWEVWDGQQLGRHIALDCETTLIQQHEVPQLCMMSASDGTNHFVVPPLLVDQLLMQHQENQLVFHNVAFDFCVLDQHLRGKESRSCLWAAVDAGRVHDTMLLAGLVQLGLDDNLKLPSLADAVQRWCGYTLDKDNYRTRYAETIGAAWRELDPGFFAYAAADAISTWQLYCKLTKQADAICRLHQLQRQYGFLTEQLQVKAAICLDLIHRTGLHVDLARAEQLQDEIDQDISSAVDQLESIDPELWHRYKKTGERKTGKENGLPKLNQTKLLEQLDEIAQQHQLDIPSTPTGKLTTSVNSCWCQFRELDPLIDAYCQYNELTKLRQFFSGLNTETIHPKYRTMVRSGRTSCYGPNIQQLPANSPIRQAITARPGHLLFVIDYNSLELRTLAAVCYQRFGFSKLREVLIDGIDPHSYAAAMFAGVSLEQFNQLPDKKQLRQRAKVFNFGLPAGFGAAALCKHAKFSYGVDLQLPDAKQFIHQLTCEVYPELRLYLKDDQSRTNKPAWTPTGRLRSAVPYTAARNTPFQGLAADGCKQAMWNLTRAGYQIVAFIHDEFVVELSRLDNIDQAADDISRICAESMQPFVPGIPVPCECALTERWDKRAEAVHDDAGRLQVWKPAATVEQKIGAAVVLAALDEIEQAEVAETPSDYSADADSQVLHGDCSELIPQLGLFDFIFADPPFNIGHGYAGYDDNRDDFPEFTQQWIAACWNACDGVLALHGPDDLAVLYIRAADQLGMRRIAWVNWHYRFGQCGRGNWIDARCHCLLFAKHEQHNWNPDAVLVDSDRKTKYADKRIHETERGGQRLPGTVWGIPSDGEYWGRVQGNSKERWNKHPNQLPIRYLQRLLFAYTNPGDRVLDPFNGSGTTGLVCKHENRRFVGIDVSEHNVQSAMQRIDSGIYRPYPTDNLSER